MRTTTAMLVGLATAGAVAATVWRARRWNMTWGATAAELAAELPGDGLVAEPSLVVTRAITIDAPPDAVWPWLAQLGYGRGGYYSYDVLENMIGLDIHSADEIVPQRQGVEAGDEWLIAPDFPLRVAVAQPGRAFVVVGEAELVPEPRSLPPFEFSWAFVLEPAESDAECTRLIVRERWRYVVGWAPLMVEPVSWVSFLMTSKMMKGIRDRAERLGAADMAAARIDG